MLSIFKKQKDWPLVVKIAKQVKKVGGRALVVGGSVRDALLKQVEIKDFDLEIYGLDDKDLKRVLSRLGKVREFGRQFGVFNLRDIDIALPRTDSRTKPGLGRKPKVISQPDLDFKQASKRRDLTINALAYDPLNGKILDAHGGLADLHRKVLRMVDPVSFGDDPLRVLRVMQFAGRFGFKIDPKTVKLCQGINLKHIANERIGEEWRKMMLKSFKPSLGLEAGRQLGIFKKLHPMLTHLKPAEWKRIKQDVDRLAGSKDVLMFTALAGRLKSKERRKFLTGINLPKAQIKAVDLLSDLRTGFKASDDYARMVTYKLSKVDLSINDLIDVMDDPARNQLMVRVAKLNLVKRIPKPLLEGRDLIKLSVAPGKKMGELLKSAFKHQLKGEFDDAHHRPKKELALKWIKQQL